MLQIRLSALPILLLLAGAVRGNPVGSVDLGSATDWSYGTDAGADWTPIAVPSQLSVGSFPGEIEISKLVVPGNEVPNGRDDIVAAKVTQDAVNIYFYVRTADPMTPSTDRDWMPLCLDTDHNAKTGWMGYDFVVNRANVRDGKTTLERNRDGQASDQICFDRHGDELERAIPRRLVGLDKAPATIDFKWADHCYARGDWTDFVLNGDAAPDGRFNFRAKRPPVAKGN